MNRVMDDTSTIKSAWGEGQTGATVGMAGVTRIEPYEENGQMAPVTWLAVFRGDTVVARLNMAGMTEIRY